MWLHIHQQRRRFFTQTIHITNRIRKTFIRQQGHRRPQEGIIYPVVVLSVMFWRVNGRAVPRCFVLSTDSPFKLLVYFRVCVRVCCLAIQWRHFGVRGEWQPPTKGKPPRSMTPYRISMQLLFNRALCLSYAAAWFDMMVQWFGFGLVVADCLFTLDGGGVSVAAVMAFLSALSLYIWYCWWSDEAID